MASSIYFLPSSGALRLSSEASVFSTFTRAVSFTPGSRARRLSRLTDCACVDRTLKSNKDSNIYVCFITARLLSQVYGNATETRSFSSQVSFTQSGPINPRKTTCLNGIRQIKDCAQSGLYRLREAKSVFK